MGSWFKREGVLEGHNIKLSLSVHFIMVASWFKKDCVYKRFIPVISFYTIGHAILSFSHFLFSDTSVAKAVLCRL